MLRSLFATSVEPGGPNPSPDGPFLRCNTVYLPRYSRVNHRMHLEVNTYIAPVPSATRRVPKHVCTVVCSNSGALGKYDRSEPRRFQPIIIPQPYFNGGVRYGPWDVGTDYPHSISRKRELPRRRRGSGVDWTDPGGRVSGPRPQTVKVETCSKLLPFI